MIFTSPCGQVKKQTHLIVPMELVFQLNNASLCDGCVFVFTAREPSDGIDAQFEISKAGYRGTCPHAKVVRFRP